MALETKLRGDQELPEPTPVPSQPFSRKDGVRDRLSGREKVAVYFAAAILSAIVVIVMVLLIGWRSPVPTLDNLPLEAQMASIARYKELTQVLSERTEKIFDLFVTKSLLPLFATLIGYLLGRRTSE